MSGEKPSPVPAGRRCCGSGVGQPCERAKRAQPRGEQSVSETPRRRPRNNHLNAGPSAAASFCRREDTLDELSRCSSNTNICLLSAAGSETTQHRPDAFALRSGAREARRAAIDRWCSQGQRKKPSTSRDQNRSCAHERRPRPE